MKIKEKSIKGNDSKKIKKDLGFKATHTIRESVEDLCSAFDKNLLKDTLENEMYFNIKRMQKISLL